MKTKTYFWALVEILNIDELETTVFLGNIINEHKALILFKTKKGALNHKECQSKEFKNYKALKVKIDV